MGNTEIFEAMADRYDTPERIQIAKITADAIREYVEDGINKHAIDFGCGTGLVGLHLLDDFQHVMFLDSSQKMLDQISRKVNDLGILNASTIRFDFETGFRDDIHADYVFMAQVLLHIQDVELVLARLYEILNPGGHLLIVDFDKNEKVKSDKVHNGFDQGSLSELMAKAGFKGMQSKTFYTGSNLFMNQEASLFIMDAWKITA